MTANNSADLTVPSDVRTEVPDRSTRDGRSEPAIAHASRDQTIHIKHLFDDAGSWTFQRRVPRWVLGKETRAKLSARLGPLRRTEARLIARHLGLLTDGLFAVVRQRRESMELDGFEPVEAAYVSERMRAAFDGEVERVRVSGLGDPLSCSTSLTVAMTHLDVDLKQIRGLSGPVAARCEGVVRSIEDDQRRLIAKHEMLNGDAEINVNVGRTNSLDAMKICFERARTSVPVMNAFMAAVFDIQGGAAGYVEFEKAFLETAERAPDEAVVPSATVPPSSADAGSASPAEDVSASGARAESDEGHGVTVTSPDADKRVSVQASDEVAPVPATGTGRDGDDPPTFAGYPDRALVARPHAKTSRYPTLSVAAGRYLSEWANRLDKTIPEEFDTSKWEEEADQPTDVGATRTRLRVFLELIGDHPIDTYVFADFQTFVNLMRSYPKNGRKEKACAGMSSRDLVLGLRADGYPDVTPGRQPIFALNTIKNGYIANVSAAIGSWMDPNNELDPVTLVPLRRLRFPEVFEDPEERDAIAGRVIVDLLRDAMKTGRISEVMLVLLALLTTRRLGLLVHLTGNDVVPQYGSREEPIYTTKITKFLQSMDENGQKRRRPIKTAETLQTFVYHRVLQEIGFIDWMVDHGADYVFAALHLYDDPERNASKRMGRILKKVRAALEVFHALRGTGIDIIADEVTRGARSVRQQAGHSGKDVHDKGYGTAGLTERRAEELHTLSLPDWLMECIEPLRCGGDLAAQKAMYDTMAKEDLRYTRRNIQSAKKRKASREG